ncbi:MAG: lipid-A-disaccharide synthase N-terminal domain-containing protein [Candidatus Rokubacteria bacterium]|nr:lipid-A-disaccharide synthase N-terminal domain-containing protein [Candidatus Rokubacteria bacterium]
MSDPCGQPIGWVLVAFGLLGQALFSARFLIQWIASERRKESVVPIHFWYFSIGGGLTLLIYAILRLDPVFIVGQAAGLFVYSRNLYLIWRKRELAASHGA